MPATASSSDTPRLLRYAAFSADPRGGNPAGVVLDARGVDVERMQAIAARLGDSETAFLVHAGDDRYRVRYFSPLAEVSFCGHATIASAVALAERDDAAVRYRFETSVGEVAVDVARTHARGCDRHVDQRHALGARRCGHAGRRRTRRAAMDAR